MNRNAKTNSNSKGKKKRDSAQRKRMVGAIIAIIIVITMLISVVEALFQANSQNTNTQVSLNDRPPIASICNI